MAFILAYIFMGRGEGFSISPVGSWGVCTHLICVHLSSPTSHCHRSYRSSEPGTGLGLTSTYLLSGVRDDVFLGGGYSRKQEYEAVQIKLKLEYNALRVLYLTFHHRILIKGAMDNGHMRSLYAFYSNSPSQQVTSFSFCRQIHLV